MANIQQQHPLEDWQTRLEDYLLVRMPLKQINLPYLICYQSYLHIRIENDSKRCQLTEEMIVAGVKIVDIKEYWKTRYPKVFTNDEIIEAVYRESFEVEEN